MSEQIYKLFAELEDVSYRFDNGTQTPTDVENVKKLIRSFVKFADHFTEFKFAEVQVLKLHLAPIVERLNDYMKEGQND